MNEEKNNVVKKDNKTVVICILVILLLVLSAYIVYDKVFSVKENQNTDNEIVDNNKEENNDKDENDDVPEENVKPEEEKVAYTFKKLTESDKTLTLGDKTYNKDFVANTLGYELQFEDNVYVWYDMLVVIQHLSHLTDDCVKVYDKDLNLIDDIVPENFGWWTEGYQGAEQKEAYEFSEEGITLYVKNVGVGGELLSFSDDYIGYDEISCSDAKGKYADVPAQEKIVYKYNKGKLEKQEKEVVLYLKDAVCK